MFALLDRLDADELRRMGFADGWQECPLWKQHLPAVGASEGDWAGDRGRYRSR